MPPRLQSAQLLWLSAFRSKVTIVKYPRLAPVARQCLNSASIILFVPFPVFWHDATNLEIRYPLDGARYFLKGVGILVGGIGDPLGAIWMWQAAWDIAVNLGKDGGGNVTPLYCREELLLQEATDALVLGFHRANILGFTETGVNALFGDLELSGRPSVGGMRVSLH
jgi:hypothetical protein